MIETWLLFRITGLHLVLAWRNHLVLLVVLGNCESLELLSGESRLLGLGKHDMRAGLLLRARLSVHVLGCFLRERISLHGGALMALNVLNPHVCEFLAADAGGFV